ncbi:MAG TPA: hypothetical protein PKX17_02715 [Candidatus Methanomethylicus sp.]|nr:hypothetical protein [Candidatus Methanomethylicus sp.]
MTTDTFSFSDISTLPRDQLITLTVGQLLDLVTQATQAVIEPLQARMDALQAQITKMESTEEQDITRIYCDIAQDRQRIAKLEHPVKVPGKTEIGRAEKIEKYLQGRPDHRAAFETLKGCLQIDNVLLNQAIKTLMDRHPGQYRIGKSPGDKRKRTLIMLPK